MSNISNTYSRFYSRFTMLASCLFLLTAVSCGVLSDRQMKSINRLSAGADSLSNTPKNLLREMAEIRKERSILFCASLSDPELIVEQLEQTARQYGKDTAFANKASLVTDVLSSYLRALRSISSSTRWENAGTELRSIGKSIDKAIENYNGIEFSRYRIRTGYARSYSELAAAISESYMKLRQKKVVKDMVSISDSLVASCCDAAMELMKSRQIDSLVQNERIAVKREFSSWIRESEHSHVSMDLDDYRDYVDLRLRAEKLEKNRLRCIGALRTLKNAHHRLLLSLKKDSGIRYEEVVADLIEMNRIINEIYTLHD